MVNHRTLNVLVLVTFWSILVGLVFDIYLRYSVSGVSLRQPTDSNSSDGTHDLAVGNVRITKTGKLFRMALLENNSIHPLPQRISPNTTQEVPGQKERIRSRFMSRADRKRLIQNLRSLDKTIDGDFSEDSGGAQVQKQSSEERVKVTSREIFLGMISERDRSTEDQEDQSQTTSKQNPRDTALQSAADKVIDSSDEQDTQKSLHQESVNSVGFDSSMDRMSDTDLSDESEEDETEEPPRQENGTVLTRDISSGRTSDGDLSQQNKEADTHYSPRQKKVFRDRIKRPRPPKCLIIGFSKCGTDALKGFLTLHPDIVAPHREVDFFTNYYFKGLDWYREQMPPSWVSQVTIEKTPEYILTREVLHRIHEYNSSMRLIVMIRDPIVRLQSLYLHDLVHKPEYSKDTTFKEWCGGRAHTAHVASVVDYATHIRDAFDIFSRRQVLVQSEEDLEESPIKVLRTVESFLGLRRAFSTDNIVYNEDKGFYCFNMTTKTFTKASHAIEMNENTGCFTASKGRHHREIEPKLYRDLVEFIRPYNKRLFELLDRRYRWENFK